MPSIRRTELFADLKFDNLSSGRHFTRYSPLRQMLAQPQGVSNASSPISIIRLRRDSNSDNHDGPRTGEGAGANSNRIRHVVDRTALGEWKICAPRHENLGGGH